MSKQKGHGDFREFVFTATGKETSLKEISPSEVFDNMVVEIERLGALVELLINVKPEEVEGRILPGLGVLLNDIRTRMDAILRIGLDKSERSNSPR